MLPNGWPGTSVYLITALSQYGIAWPETLPNESGLALSVESRPCLVIHATSRILPRPLCRVQRSGGAQFHRQRLQSGIVGGGNPHRLPLCRDAQLETSTPTGVPILLPKNVRC